MNETVRNADRPQSAAAPAPSADTDPVIALDLPQEEDRARLREVGFSERDIWDIAAVAGFFNMTNRVASATEMRPNHDYHRQARRFPAHRASPRKQSNR